jgi:hypothetical protein
MLSAYQQKLVWDGLLGAEIRSAYFAELSGRYVRTQRRLVVGSLLLSSGAFLSLVTTVVPTTFAWIKPLLALFAAALSFWSLLAKNERGSIDAADLHFRWNVLALEYQSIWANVESETASARLAEIEKREAELSKSSVAFPEDESLMVKCQDNVVMHHQRELPA